MNHSAEKWEELLKFASGKLNETEREMVADMRELESMAWPESKRQDEGEAKAETGDTPWERVIAILYNEGSIPFSRRREVAEKIVAAISPAPAANTEGIRYKVEKVAYWLETHSTGWPAKNKALAKQLRAYLSENTEGLRNMIMVELEEIPIEGLMMSNGIGAQMIDGKWYSLKWGCDTMQHILDAVLRASSQESYERGMSSPDGPVADSDDGYKIQAGRE